MVDGGRVESEIREIRPISLPSWSGLRKQARRIRGPLLIIALVAALGVGIVRLTVPEALLFALLGRAPFSELSPGEAGGALTGFFVVLVLLGAVSSMAFVRRLRTRNSGIRAQPWLIALVATGLTLILLGVIHILLGSFVPLDVSQRGFWNDRAAFSSAMTTVGGTLIGFAGLAWSLTAEQQARDQRESKRERIEQKRAIDRTIVNVENVIESADRLAGRGLRIAIERLTSDIAVTRPDDEEASAPSPERRNTHWFRDLFERDGECPDTTRKLVEIVGERLKDSREWRAAQQFCDYIDATAIELAADAQLWLGEYLELRNEKVSGVSSEVPLDLLPVVDDLEFVRDLVRIGIDLEQDGNSRDATSEHLVILAAVIASLQERAAVLHGMTSATRPSSPDAAVGDGQMVPGADVAEGEWPINPVDALRSALAMMDYANIFDDDRRGWCDVLMCDDTSLNGWSTRSLLGVVSASTEPEEDFPRGHGDRDIVHHLALAMLAPVRRSRLKDAIADCKKKLDSASVVESQSFWDGVKNQDALKKVPFGLMVLRADLERLEWPVVTQQEGISRFVDHGKENADQWERLNPVGAFHVPVDDRHLATRRRFDWPVVTDHSDGASRFGDHAPHGRD